jgi:hypothetical protein
MCGEPITGVRAKDIEAGRRVRAGTLAALIAGIISVAIGYLAGELVRDAICQASDAWLKTVIHCTVAGHS